MKLCRFCWRLYPVNRMGATVSSSARAVSMKISTYCCPGSTEQNVNELNEEERTETQQLIANIQENHQTNATDSQKQQQEGDSDGDATDAKEQNEDDPDSSSQLPLPGSFMLERTLDLKQDLAAVKTKFAENYSELMPREWTVINRDVFDDEKRQSDTVKVMQINMLADGLSGAYTSTEDDKSFIGVDKECLQWTYRSLRIVEEITRFDPDIVCLQECDQIAFLMEYLTKFGYEAHQQKSSATIQSIAANLTQERGQEISMPDCNIVILVKLDKLKLFGEIQKVDYTQNNAKVNGLVVPLQCVENERTFMVVTTHLKSTKTEEGEKLRKEQINALLSKEVRNDHKLPIILCCDLNANPVRNKNGYEPLCYEALTSTDGGLGYKSVYKLGSADGQEPEYTTCKQRKQGVDKHTIDYICVNDESVWEIVALLGIPKLDGHVTSLPAWSYPSDHFSLCAQLAWKPAP